MFVIAMIVAGMAFAALLGLIVAGLYISVMEPASPGEQQWQQGEAPRKRAGAEPRPASLSQGRLPVERDGKLTRMPNA